MVGPLGLKEIWTTRAADICPFTVSTFWAEYKLWGSAPLPYHLVNVLLHGTCGVVLWRALVVLRVPGAWLGAALWTLHPVEVESVAWISEMKNTESALFFLLSILFYAKYLRKREGDGQTRHWYYTLTLLFGALALASKSSTVFLPIVLVGCMKWIQGEWRIREALKLVPLFLMSLASGLVALWTQHLQLAGGDFQWTRTWPERVATAGDAVWFYLGKLVWPHPLLAVYPSWNIDTANWVSYLPTLAVVMVLLILWFQTWDVVAPLPDGIRLFPDGFASGVGIGITILFFAIHPWLITFSTWPAWGRWLWLGRWRPRGAARFAPELNWLKFGLTGGILLVLGNPELAAGMALPE